MQVQKEFVNVNDVATVDGDPFDLPEGIVLVSKLTTGDKDEEEDDIVCHDDSLAEDVKPSLKELVQRLGNIPDIVLYSSDSESDDVPEDLTLESTVENSCDVSLSMAQKRVETSLFEPPKEMANKAISDNSISMSRVLLC